LKKLLSDSFPIRVYVLKIILLVNKFVEIQMQLERGFDPIARVWARIGTPAREPSAE
jgi:hypothetical protein